MTNHSFLRAERLPGVAESRRLVARREASPTELLEQVFAQIEKAEPLVRSFAWIDGDGARAAARKLTAEAARGELRGPLHGVPLAVKDVVDVAGLPMCAGSRVLQGNVSRNDAPVVTRLRAAGAIVVGKSTTHEFAHGVTTPPTRNPCDLERIAGGSSGGSAAAVAAGMVPAAIGTDTGGSVRVPAALCGVLGLRPTIGAIPTDGCVPFSPRMDTVGPIARTATDLALIYGVMSGREQVSHEIVTRLRVGVVPRALLGEVDSEVIQVVEDAVRTLGDQGAESRLVNVPPFPEWERPRSTYVLSDFLDVHRRAGWWPARSESYGDEIRTYLTFAETINSVTRREAIGRLQTLEREFLNAIRDIDVLLLPVTPIPAPRTGDAERVDEGELRRPIVAQLIRLCGPISWCGLAAASVPWGTTTAGLPIGVQVAGRDVETVFGVVTALERSLHAAQAETDP